MTDEVDVTSTTSGTFPALPLPQSNAHLAPVPPTLEAEGVATTSPTGEAIIPARYVPLALAGVGALTLVGNELANPAPWNAARAVGVVTLVLGQLLAGAVPGLRRKP